MHPAQVGSSRLVCVNIENEIERKSEVWCMVRKSIDAKENAGQKKQDKKQKAAKKPKGGK